MDFSYPETHEEVKKLSAQILGDFAEPDRLKRLEAEGPYFDRELWASIVDSGLHTATLPESLGGMGLDFMACTVIAEQLGYTAASIPYISTVAACIQPLLNYANHSTVKTALAGFIDGSSLVTAAWLEPFNENPLTPDISARRDGDKLHLTGNKHCVPYAADSTYVLLSANVEGELCAALLATQQAGVQLTEQLCTANEPQFLLALNNAEANIICRGDDASRLIQQSLAMATSAYCSMAGGINEKMARIGGEYTSQREQFGVAIATFQAVAHKLANCYIDAECMKIIALKASGGAGVQAAIRNIRINHEKARIFHSGPSIAIPRRDTSYLNLVLTFGLIRSI